MAKSKTVKRKMKSSKDFLVAKSIVFVLFALYAFTLIFNALGAYGFAQITNRILSKRKRIAQGMDVFQLRYGVFVGSG